jgi:Transposase IS116/IS110/IS902 family
VVALRTPGLRQVQVDDTTVALRLLVDRRDQLGRTRTEIVSRLHHLLLELVPGGAKKDLSAQQARALLGTVRPRDVIGKTRRWLASELIHELTVIDKKIKIANQELTELVASTGSRLQDLHGIGPSGAARLLGDIGDIGRFTSRAHFASWHGTAPIDASSGDQNRHRLSRAGTGASTAPRTSWPSSSCDTTPTAAATTDASSPPARPRWKPYWASPGSPDTWGEVAGGVQEGCRLCLPHTLSSSVSARSRWPGPETNRSVPWPRILGSASRACATGWPRPTLTTAAPTG